METFGLSLVVWIGLRRKSRVEYFAQVHVQNGCYGDVCMYMCIYMLDRWVQGIPADALSFPAVR